MKIKETIKKDKKIIDKVLLKILSKYADKKNLLYPILKYTLFPGGKRIRAILCMESCFACGGKTTDALIAACSIEIIHNFSLVHDDLPAMDDDDYRRGKLTCHKKYGEANAILAGDALSVLAFEILQEIKNTEKMRDIIKILSKCTGLYGMIGGQALDIKYLNKNKTEHMLDKINELKTAELFIAAIIMGGICAGANKNKMKAIGKYARFFGEAFQIRDDILDDEYKKKELNAKKIKLSNTIEKAKTCLDILGHKAHNLMSLVELLRV